MLYCGVQRLQWYVALFGIDPAKQVAPLAADVARYNRVFVHEVKHYHESRWHMKRWTFTVYLTGKGETPEDAWADLNCESFGMLDDDMPMTYREEQADDVSA